MKRVGVGDSWESVAAAHGPRRLACAVALLVSAALGASISYGQSTPEKSNGSVARAPAASRPPQNLDDAIRQLGSTRWAERDAATTYLLRQSVTVLPDVEDAVIHATDPEVTARLELVAAHLFLKAQTPLRGQSSLLGIHLAVEWVSDFQRLRASIAVLEPQLGFPAFEVLEAGDRIIAVDGQELPPDLTVDSFRRDVGPREPGSQIRLTILRGQEQLDVSIMLAGISEQGAYALSEFVRLRLEQVTAFVGQLTAREVSHKILVIPDDEGQAWQPPIKDLR